MHIDLRAGRVVRLRMSAEPGAAPEDMAVRDVLARVARHLVTGREQLEEIPVDLDELAPFQRRTLEAIRAIPPGCTMTYAEVARLVGRGPGAARAVGGAMAANPVPLIVPCHRVVPANGAPFANYSGWGGVATKRALLRLEGASAQEGLGRFGAVADVEREPR